MRVTRVIGRISVMFAAVAMVQVVVLMVIMVYEVICRFGFNSPNIWTYDVAYMLSGTLVLLGAGFTSKEGGHVRIDFISHHFSLRATCIIETIFGLFFFLPILGYITWGVTEKAWEAFASGQTNYTSPWAPVMWPFYSGIALGLVGLWLQVLAQLLEHLSSHKRGECNRAT